MLYKNINWYEKREKCLYASFFLCIIKISKLPHQRWDIYYAVSQQILQPLFKQRVFGFLRNVVMGER